MADLLENTPAEPVIDDPAADVRSAFEQLKGEAPPPPATTEKAAATAADTQPPSGERLRNERGQFIKADGTVDTAAETAKPVSDADPPKANVEQPSKAAEAPAGWSAEAKAEFGKLTPVVQAAVLKRESEINEGGARWSEEKKTLLGHFEPVRAISEQYKAHPAEVIKRLAAADRFLESDPNAAIAWLAKAYNVDLSKLAANPPVADPLTPPQPQADPRLNELQSKLTSVEQRLEAEDQRAVNSTIETFATAKDAAGQPLRPHWDAVKTDVGYILLAASQAGKHDVTLEKAYEQACWAAPDIRAKLLAASTATADATARQREAAEKARRGTFSARGAPNGAVVPPASAIKPDAPMEDYVRAAMEQLRPH